MILRIAALYILFQLTATAYGQVIDDFADGDFLVNPTWSGSTSAFQITSGVLNTNNDPDNDGLDQYYLSTPSSLSYGASWEFFIDLKFSTSGANYVDVYLMSDQQNLTNNSINGYFLRFGDTDDEIVLYKSTSGIEDILIDFGDDLFNSSASNPFKIQVSRDVNNLWTLKYDDGNTGTFVTGGTATDATFNTSSHFGFLVIQSGLNGAVNGHFIDEIETKQIDIEQVIVNSNSSIEVQFNQEVGLPEAEDVSNYSINGITIVSAIKNGSSVILEFEPTIPLTEGNYTIIAASALTKNESTSSNFSYLQLDLISTITVSDNELELEFNDDLDETKAQNVINFLVDSEIGNPNSSTLSLEDKSKITLTFGDTFLDGINYQLSISGLDNQSLNSTFSGSANFEFIIPLVITAISVVSEASLLVSFNKPLEPVSAETFGNYLVDGSIGNPISAVLQAGNQSVLLSFSPSFSDADYNLTISNLKDTGDNIINSSGNSISFSYLPLIVSGIEQVDNEKIRVGFNQKVAQISAELITNYEILAINPTSVTLETSDSIVILTLPNLVNNSYSLSISNIENQIQNAVLVANQQFDFQKPTPFRDIIVTEIMVDPTPSIGQPLAEYVELYNRSTQDIKIDVFDLNGSSLPDYTIASGAYLLISSTTNYTNFFSSIPNAIGQTGFDALSNSGDFVALKDQFGNQVDSLFYDLSWYDDEIKDDGGYSLELINPNQVCSEDNNWTASIDATGGTPALQNSVYSIAPDVISPNIVSLEVINPQTIEIQFNEPIDLASINVPAFDILGLEVDDVVAQSSTQFLLSLASDLSSESFYTINFIGIVDCSGNVLAINSFEFYYDITPPAFSDLVILSETALALKFNEPLQESIAEIESNYRIAGVPPDRAILQDSASNRVHLTFEIPFISPVSYMVEWENIRDTTGNATSLQQVPFTYQSQLDSAYVLAPNLIAIKFIEKPSAQTAMIATNYTNEDGINPTQVSIDELDSTLIRLSFTENFDENKSLPIYVEGIRSKTTGEPLITPAITFIYDTRPPTVALIETTSANELIVTWNEAINTTIALSSTRYSLANGERPTGVTVLSGRSISLDFASPFPMEEEQILSVSGIPDIYGNVFVSARKVSFMYDITPPILKEVIRSSEQTVRLTYHEKLLADSLFQLSNFSLANTNPTEVLIHRPDSTSFTLTFDNIVDLESTSFSVKNVVDKTGNVVKDSILNLNTIVPYLVSISALTDTSLVIAYSKPMGESAGILENYASGDNNLETILKLDDKQFSIELNPKMNNGDLVTIDMANILDSEANSIIQPSSSFIYQDLFTEFRFIDDQTIELTFDTEFQIVLASQFLLASTQPQIAVLDGEEKNVVRLFFAQEIPDNIATKLKWQNLIDTYGRRLPDLEIEVINDRLPPELIEIESDFFGTLNLTFNESLEEESASSPNLFSVIGLGNPNAVSFSGSDVISLDFEDRLVTGQSYQLIITNLADLSSNFLFVDTTAFIYNPSAIPNPGDIIITEYMADPAPIVGLPEVEYIELFNKSDQPINLKSMRLINQDDIVPIGDYLIESGEYVLIVAESNAFQFDIDNKFGMEKFPDLLNTVGGVGLISITGDYIDLVIYNISWYGDTEKDNGGYSLELINPESSCFGKANWTASSDVSGGTPGRQNSVYSLDPDMDAPSIFSYDLIGTDSLKLNFNEPMDSLSIVEGSFSVTGLSILNISTSAPYFEEALIHFGEDITSGVIYDLSINGLKDCSGNDLAEGLITFGLGRKPTFNEILITEIMADPDPVIKDLPNSEYLEIFNSTSELLSLEDLILTDGSDTTELPSQMLEPQAYLILSPTSAADNFSEIGNAMGVSNWTSLANGGEQLSLWVENELIFEISYDQDWYEEEKSSGGYSLEMKDTSNPCGGRLVWGSAISTNGGTPGNVNSNSESVPDNFGPELVSAFVKDEQTIELIFSETLDLGQNVAITITPTLNITSIAQEELIRDRLVVLVSENIEQNVLYELEITNASDCNGNMISLGLGTFVLPSEADSLSLIINEVLFNPNTGGVDFVEIYNNSDNYIDLKEWSLAREVDGLNDQVRTISESETILAPRGYLALSTSANDLILQYPNGKNENFLTMSSFPTYANNEGVVILLDINQNTIDQFNYLDDYHSSLLESVEGVSLERIDFNTSTQNPSNWASASSTVGFSTPGYINSQNFDIPKISGSLKIEPRVFVPGSASLANPSFTTINYQFDKAGQFANVTVYDQYGRPIQEIANGASLSASGFMRWDGTDSSGKRVNSGYYLVVFEVFDGSGNKEILKETVVVGWE